LHAGGGRGMDAEVERGGGGVKICQK